MRNLTVKDFRGVTMVDDVSFDVRAGEIVGIAGVAGNGQSELIEAISGIRRAVSGSVMLDGKPIDVIGIADPGELRDRGLAHVPEDRHHVGLVLAFEENENSILGYHDKPAISERAVPRHRRDPSPTPRRRSRNTTSARPIRG